MAFLKGPSQLELCWGPSLPQRDLINLCASSSLGPGCCRLGCCMMACFDAARFLSAHRPKPPINTRKTMSASCIKPQAFRSEGLCFLPPSHVAKNEVFNVMFLRALFQEQWPKHDSTKQAAPTKLRSVLCSTPSSRIIFDGMEAFMPIRACKAELARTCTCLIQWHWAPYLQHTEKT